MGTVGDRGYDKFDPIEYESITALTDEQITAARRLLKRHNADDLTEMLGL